MVFIIFFGTTQSFSKKNVIHVDILEQIAHSIHIEKSLSGESESSTFYENVFNGERSLTCQTLRLLFLFEYKRVSNPFVTIAQSGYSELFSFWFSESWYPFSQSGMDNVMDCSLEVSEFNPQSHYYVHFPTNTLGKGMNLFSPRYELSSTIVVLLQWLFWH